uniref:Uncharacterized protein n=1 Tax=Amphimedon queenslandica TaxID=400682 RepID=A0A1X7U510_AMPQE
MKQLPESELKKLHDSPIDIYDPLWYENTSTPLNEACWRGSKDEVQRLIDKTGLQERGRNGWSPPLAASYGGHIDVLCLLIDVYHCDPSQGDDDSVISLHMASYRGHLNIVQHLVNECHVDPDIADSSGNTGLLYSALGGHVDLVIMFLKKKCNVSQVNREGSTLSLLACKSGQVALVYELKQFGIFLEDDIDFKGCGIVHYCAMNDKVELLEYLYDNYKSELFQKRNRFGATPLHIACQYASSGFIMNMVNIFGYKVLLEADYSGRSSLHYLCSGLVDKYCITEVYNKLTAPCDIPLLMQMPTFNVYYKEDWLKYISLNINVTKQHKRVSLLSTLLKKTSSINAVEYIINTTDIDINITCNECRTPLHYSCHHGNVDLTQYLIEVQDSDINITDNKKWNALTHSAESGNMKLVKYFINNYQLPLTSLELLQAVAIIEYKLDPQVKDGDGMQLVHFAAEVGAIDVLQYLVKECGCDLDRVGGTSKSNYTSLMHSTNDNDALPIHLACVSGVLQLVTFLIDVMKCGDVTTEDKRGLTCVTRACASGNFVSFKLLIKQYNLNPRIFSRTSSPAAAVLYGHVHILEWLKQEYLIDVVSFKNGLLPYHAAQQNKLYCLEHLLNNYFFDINATYSYDDTQSTLIHKACQKGHVAIVLYLTSLPQCDVSAKTSNGSTVLHLSCRSHSLPILKHLVEEHQLDLTIKDYNGMAPIHVACEEGSLSIVKYIIDNSPLSLDMTDSFGRTPLLIAAFSKNLPIIRYLNMESHGLDPESEDKDGVTCLHILAKQGDEEIYEHLVPHVWNNPTPKDKAGRSPLHYAGRHYEMSVYLIQSFNIHPEDKDINGFTGVHAACQAGNIQLVSHYLTNLKCDKNILTNSSKGLLYFACRSGNLELVHILIDKFDLVPVQEDIDGARSVNAESIVKFLEARISLSKLVHEFVKEAEKRQLVPTATKPHPSFLSS